MELRAAVLASVMLVSQAACSTAGAGGGSGEHPSGSAATGDGTSEPVLSVAAMQEKLAKSRTAWRAQLASKGRRYTYSRSFLSWTGFSSETTFVVDGDKVVERRYWERTDSSTTGTSLGPSWTETGAEIGSHPNADPAVTLDALYDQCAQTLAKVDLATTSVLLDVDRDGVLRVCQTMGKNCADDCNIGPSINALYFGN